MTESVHSIGSSIPDSPWRRLLHLPGRLTARPAGAAVDQAMGPEGAGTARAWLPEALRGVGAIPQPPQGVTLCLPTLELASTKGQTVRVVTVSP